ncbi:FecR domain-containing protein [Pedobacter gandavensis]|uniref:FecR family protein n=1 Tax=Pedobacter gandavensis TaxID=2679963 RepID=UPI00247ACF6E|nr:FecR domain-containing protein [Pedobacter gandavensis]WGQ11842.1 FecR domain-containing protein [Pedobacter gandavensis]
MQKKEVTDLLKKYLAGNCSEEECGLLETWYLKYEEKALPEVGQETKDAQLEEIWVFLSKRMERAFEEPIEESHLAAAPSRIPTIPAEITSGTAAVLPGTPVSSEIQVIAEAAPSIPLRKTPLIWTKIAVAATVLFALSIGFYFYNIPDKTGKDPQEQLGQSEINPVHQKAMLTLADGRRITLDEAQNGEIAEQGGVIITKTKDGQLVYEGAADEGSATEKSSAGSSANAVAARGNSFNKIETPKGGQYEVSLPDGTKVWLNAASSLSYPASFTGDKREVKLLGEAYFEVAKNKNMPFVVHSKGQDVEVLGTHFNVNAYADEEQTKTTLLEGSVKVKLLDAKGAALLKPGQQSVYEGNQLDVNAIDVAEVMAWKEGYFLFQDEDIRSIMRKIARWYDVEMVYAPNISPKKIGGRISRNKSLDYVLKTISRTDKFNFKVEGRRVTVMP